jgi:hypothetical protein
MPVLAWARHRAIGQYRRPMLFLSPGAGFLKMFFLPFPGREQSVRSPLKVPIIPTFRGIVSQVRIFVLEMPFLPFSAEIFSWQRHFFYFQLFFDRPLSFSCTKLIFVFGSCESIY